MYSEIVRLRSDLIESRRIASEARRIASEDKLKLKAAEQRINELEAALKRADKHCKTKARARAWASQVNAAVTEHGAGDDGARQRLIQQRTPLNRPPERLTTGRGAPRANRSVAATDSGNLSRSSVSRRRGWYFGSIDRIIKAAGPRHLPGVTCPDIKADRAGHFNYKSRVSVCVYTCEMRVHVREGGEGPLGRLGD